METSAKNAGKRSSALSVVAEQTVVAENEEASLAAPRKNKTAQLRPADLDLIERVRRKFAEGVKQLPELGNTQADNLDLIRLSLEAALSPEVSPKQLATLMPAIRAKKKPSRAPTKGM